jgi:hypothetical protein
VDDDILSDSATARPRVPDAVDSVDSDNHRGITEETQSPSPLLAEPTAHPVIDDLHEEQLRAALRTAMALVRHVKEVKEKEIASLREALRDCQRRSVAPTPCSNPAVEDNETLPVVPDAVLAARSFAFRQETYHAPTTRNEHEGISQARAFQHIHKAAHIFVDESL